MAYSFDFENKIIDILNPQTDVVIQDLYLAIREAEESFIGISYDKICNGSGKEPLGSGVVVGITLELLEWQIRFWSGNYIAKVSGGNLVGGINGDPVAYSEGVQVLIIQSAASTIVQVSTGSGLAPDERNQLMNVVATRTGVQSVQNEVVAVQGDVTDIKDDTTFMKKVIINKREITQSNGASKIVIYDNNDITPILEKELKDKNGNDIAELADGVLTIEEKSSV